MPDYEPGRHVELIFDGAMSHPRVYVNGKLAGEWEYGYNTFSVDITPYVKASDNVLAVNLYNEKGQSRWYPGAGLYRNVHLIVTDEARIPTWGVQVSRLTLRKARPTSKCARLSSCPKTAAVTASRRR